MQLFAEIELLGELLPGKNRVADREVFPKTFSISALLYQFLDSQRQHSIPTAAN